MKDQYNPTFADKCKPMPGLLDGEQVSEVWSNQQLSDEARNCSKESDREQAAREQAEKEAMLQLQNVGLGISIGMVKPLNRRK